ncbi:MAG TPA: lysophospholipid acyltransferase family protein [Rubrobacteraceae bacterium]|nr:lysophospholipid acyltransferase family protein [Rubrobacteraceae bacterium]
MLSRTYWAGWTGWAFGNPLTRLVSRRARVVPIDPQRAGVSSLAFGAAVLARGKSLIWFPEGERSPSGELQQFRPGIALWVPCMNTGTHKAMPRGKVTIRPTKITAIFGKPLDVSNLEDQGESSPGDRIVQALRDRVAELGDALNRSQEDS